MAELRGALIGLEGLRPWGPDSWTYSWVGWAFVL